MRQFPKVLNTKADVNLCLQEFPEKTKAMLQLELDNYEGWVNLGTYDSPEGLVENDTHKVEEQEIDGEVMYSQLSYQVIPGNWIDRVGYTIQEIEELLK